MSDDAITPRGIDEVADRMGTATESELERVRLAVRGIRFGEVRVVIQEGRIVQIERLEKQRFR